MYLNNKGFDAFFHACVEGKTSVLQLLLDHKADPNIKSSDVIIFEYWQK